jgi:hypothetical protein
MNILRVAIAVFVCETICVFGRAETPPDDPDALLQKTLHLGDLYNWAHAASLFTEAEHLYAARGN